MTEFMKYPRSPIAVEGWPIIGATIVLALIWFGIFWLTSSGQIGLTIKWISGCFGFFFLAAGLFSIWFFRNPERRPESSDQAAVISAADGTVLKIEDVVDPRYGGQAAKVSIFMSPLDVHVNRSPASGVVEKVQYSPGKFFAANLDKASTDNERNLVLIKTDSGHLIGFMQIAGFIARRIVCHVHGGERLGAGQRYGMIRFGSRMEMFMPPGTEILVKQGYKIFAGQTIVGRLSKLPAHKD